MRNMNSFITSGLAILLSSFILSGCGSSSTTGEASLADTLTGIQNIPSVSGLVKSQTASSAKLELGIRGATTSLFVTSGTPPTVHDLINNATLVDTAFFGGAVAAINTAQTATQAQAQAYWEGQSKCWLAQGAIESVSRMLQSGTSLCYLRNIAAEETPPYTVVSGSIADPKLAFAQGDTAKVIKVQISGDGEGNEDIFLNVKGKDTDPDGYHIIVYGCQSGSVTWSEEISINRATGVYASTNSHNGQHGKGAESVTAYLKVQSGSVVFDLSQARSMTSQWSGNWGDFKGYASISGDDVVTSKRYNSFTWEGNSGKDKNYSVASFRGDSLKNMRFLEGGAAGISSWGGNENHKYSGASEYQSPTYASVTSGTYYSAVNNYDFASDAFFTQNLSVATPTFSHSCSATPNVTVAINMGNNAAMMAISSKCEGDRMDNYSMCNSSSIQRAQGYVFQSQSYND